ncbi:MAG: hypothetical protein WD768_16610 [Phycisphaeraceae bacterium]
MRVIGASCAVAEHAEREKLQITSTKTQTNRNGEKDKMGKSAGRRSLRGVMAVEPAALKPAAFRLIF